ncbi:MAG TPA: hypothetical protein V6D15_06965 [Oculatellaceae cyanobacterium]
MKNLISSAIAQISSLLNGFQAKRFLAVVAVGFLLLTTNVDSASNSRAIAEQVLEKAHQTDSVRPKTANEWKQEARETEDAPGARAKNIAEETGQALKEFGALYPKTAEASSRDNN